MFGSVRKGTTVSVVYGNLVRLGRVKHGGRWVFVAHFRGQEHQYHTNERGLTWAPGWFTKEAQALRAAHAL